MNQLKYVNNWNSNWYRNWWRTLPLRAKTNVGIKPTIYIYSLSGCNGIYHGITDWVQTSKWFLLIYFAKKKTYWTISGQQWNWSILEQLDVWSLIPRNWLVVQCPTKSSRQSLDVYRQTHITKVTAKPMNHVVNIYVNIGNPIINPPQYHYWWVITVITKW